MKRQWDLDALIDHWTLLPHEHQFIASIHEPHNRLGVAVLLKSFLIDGYFPAERDDVPTTVVTHLAKQLALASSLLIQYDWHGRSASRHRTAIRERLGFRESTLADQDDLKQWLCDHLLTTHQTKLATVTAVAYTRCRTRQIEPPTAERMERLIDSTLTAYRTQWYDRILGRLSAESRAALQTLITNPIPLSDAERDADPSGNPYTVFHTLRADPGPMRVATAHEEVAKLTQLRALALPENLFADVPLAVVRSYRQHTASQETFELRAHPEPLRMTMLAAFCWLREREVTDTLAELLMEMIQHIGVKADQRVTRELVKESKHIPNKTGILHDLLGAALDQPDGIVRDVLFGVVDEQTLRDLHAELHATKAARRQRVQTVMHRSYGSHYRQMARPLLATLTFRTNLAKHQPLMTAIAWIKQHLDADDVFVALDATLPTTGIIPRGWRDQVIEVGSRGQSRIRRATYEICVLQALRETIRCKEVWIERADRHRNPDDDLPHDFDDQRATYYATLQLPLDVEAFLTSLRHEHEAALDHFHRQLPKNPHVRILEKEGGWIELSPLAPQTEPPLLRALKAELGKRWTHTTLLDILKETDTRVGLTDRFTSLTSREHLDRTVLNKRLLLCLYGLGTNIGLKRMAMGNGDVTEKELRYVRKRFLSCDHLREANARLVNAILQVRQPAIWGLATTSCASDAKQFGAWDQNLMSKWHARYRRSGVVIYWHVERRSTCIYSQLQSCAASEVAAMMTGVLRHCTEMEVERQYVDSHGQSEVAFGICRLLGFELCPRLKPMQSQKLYLPSEAHAARYTRLAPVLTRAIDWNLIRDQYDDMVKYATALRSGIAEPEAILRRFTRQTGHATYRAMAELGRVIKTVFLCRYLQDRKFRYEIHEGLNVIEHWNSTNSFIFYGKGGEMATNKRENQEFAMLALHLLQNCLVYINTLMMQEILDDPAWMARMTKADFRGITPLVYHHVNPYGMFPLDLTIRIPLRQANAA